MARVEWSRLTGEDIESIYGVLLAREYPRSTRLKPSQGDGGIDILVPGAEGYTVFQVKGYTGSISTSRKRHITNSWKRFQEYARERNLSIHEWFLSVPENPTKEQLDWISKLTSGAAHYCGWERTRLRR